MKWKSFGWRQIFVYENLIFHIHIPFIFLTSLKQLIVNEITVKQCIMYHRENTVESRYLKVHRTVEKFD
jgi:hypothetical protein